MRASCFSGCTARQRRARTPVNASLKRSPAATALRCSVLRPAEELAARCALRSNSLGKPVNVRASRVAASPVLLSALEAHCRVSAHAFAEAALVHHRWRTCTRLRGRRCPAGAISEAARRRAPDTNSPCGLFVPGEQEGPLAPVRPARPDSGLARFSALRN